MIRSFAERWLDKERERGFADISQGMVRTSAELPTLDSESRQLLASSGLPASAAPCLSFDFSVKMPRIWEVFAPGQWDERKKSHLLHYRILGTDGAGNPICVDEETGEVTLLDHEDWFRTRQIVNSSIAKLAECLLLYMGEQDADVFSKSVESVDAPALSKGSFWWHEVACLRENAG